MIDLPTLLAPLSPEDFFRDYWPERPYASNDGAERVRALEEVPELASVEALLTSAPRVAFFRPDGGTGHVAGDKAITVYRLGLTCFVGCAHVPALMDAAERLAAELGMPTGSVTCEAFCSDAAGGVRMHSDHDVNFALLLHGEKRWRIAANTHIRNQTAVCRPASHEQHDPAQLELADELPFPENIPDYSAII
jgi:hypothetical protein